MLTLNDLHRQNLILLEAVSGSRAYGLATPESDTDIKGVFYLPRSLYYGLDYIRSACSKPPATSRNTAKSACGAITATNSCHQERSVRL